MEYNIIRAGNFSVLSSAVNDAIKQGWRPQGGIAIKVEVSGTLSKSYDDYEGDVSSSSYYYQALIKD